MNGPLITQPSDDGSAKAAALRGETATPQPRSGGSLRTPIHWQRVGWMASLFGVVAAAVYVAAQVRSVTIPMLMALTIAYVLNPVVDRIERHGLGRTPAIVMLLVISLICGATMLLLLGPAIGAELGQVPFRFQELLIQGRPWVERTFKVSIPTNIDAVLSTVQEEFIGRPDLGMAAMARSTGSILKIIFGSTVSLLAPIGGVLMTPFFVFYLLRDFHCIVRGLQNLVPLPFRPAVLAQLHEIDTTLSAFARGQLIVGSLLAVIYAVGFTLVGLPLGLVLGILTGLGNMIPYVGTVFGLTAATLLTVVSWHGWTHLALVYGVFMVNQSLEAWIITPRVVGNQVGLSPLLVIVAVLVFGELFGFFGVLVAVPVTAILKILLRVALQHYRASWFYTGEPLIS